MPRFTEFRFEDDTQLFLIIHQKIIIFKIFFYLFMIQIFEIWYDMTVHRQEIASIWSIQCARFLILFFINMLKTCFTEMFNCFSKPTCKFVSYGVYNALGAVQLRISWLIRHKIFGNEVHSAIWVHTYCATNICY